MTQESRNPEEQIVQQLTTPEPSREHRWLQRLIGEWTFEAPAQADQAAAPLGTETVRALGEIWVVCEGQGQMPDGGPAQTMMTLGYDPEKKRFVGTWIGSMMSYLWVYDGELDPSGRVLTLSAVGPSLAGDGKMLTYQDIIELKSDDHRLLTARVQKDDGSWQQFMSMEYRRRR
jgi:hypothetical protein